MRDIISELEKKIEKKRVLIIGDVMIDAYLFGTVDRISPEAPVPIVNLLKRNNRLGGAANVALNIQSLGAIPVLCSVIGSDDKGKEFLQMLKDNNLSTEGMMLSENRITTTKFRIIGNNAQLLRVDEEDDSSLSADDNLNLLNHIINILDHKKVDSIIFEDYDKGVLSMDLIEKIIQKANLLKIPVTVDPKKRNFNAYSHCTIFKPNLKELKEGTKADIDYSNIDAISNLIEKYIDQHNIKIALITLSEKGVLIVWKESDNAYQHKLIPAHFRNIVDVSGAGDTVISVVTLCNAIGLSHIQMAAIANLAGGLVCEEVGVIPISKEKLLNEIVRLKLIN
ncbi:MAG: bifunctional ADP-heptose synthase [Bacteroidota bacterium]